MCERHDDLSILMAEGKQKCATSSKQEILKLLKLVPKSWTVQRAIEKCGVSKYVVKLVQ
jgi:hypothetical protein